MKLSKSRIVEQKSENIVVVVSMVAILILLFIVVGWSGIKTWLTTPLIWRGQDSLSVHCYGVVPVWNTDADYKLYLGLENHTDKEIDDYDMRFLIGDDEIKYTSLFNDEISAYGMTDVTLEITTDGSANYGQSEVSQATLEMLKDPSDDLVDCRIIKLESNGDTVVNNNGLLKVILTIVLSLALGIIGFFGSVDKQWVRILLKVCALPIVIVCLLLVAAFYAVNYANSPEGQAAAEKGKQEYAARKKSEAQRKYDHAAHTKAACEARGDYKGAAYAQETMDRQMAEILKNS